LPWVTVARASFTVDTGVLSWFASTARVQRGFCPRCASPVAYLHADRPDEIDLTLGTVDQPEAFEPIDHIWMEDALPWDQPADGRPCFAQLRP
jgi:hypothetical protein